MCNIENNLRVTLVYHSLTILTIIVVFVVVLAKTTTETSNRQVDLLTEDNFVGLSLEAKFYKTLPTA